MLGCICWMYLLGCIEDVGMGVDERVEGMVNELVKGWIYWSALRFGGDGVGKEWGNGGGWWSVWVGKNVLNYIETYHCET